MSVTLSDDQARLAMKALDRARDAVEADLSRPGAGHTAFERMAMEHRAERYEQLAIDIWSELKGGQDGTGDAGAAGA